MKIDSTKNIILVLSHLGKKVKNKMGQHFKLETKDLSKPHSHKISEFLILPSSGDNVSQLFVNAPQDRDRRERDLIMDQVIPLLPQLKHHCLSC